MKRFFEQRILAPVGTIGALALLLLGLVVAGEVVSRAFGYAVVGGVEVSEVLLAVLVFTAIAYTQVADGHVAMEAFVNLMPESYRRLAHAGSLVVCTAVAALLAYGAGMEAVRSYVEKEFQFGTTHFPLWPTKSIVAIGLALLAIELLLQAAAAIRALFRRADGRLES